MDGREPLASALGENTDEVDHRAGVPHRRGDGSVVANVAGHNTDLADAAHRLQEARGLRRANRNPDERALHRQPLYNVTAQET